MQCDASQAGTVMECPTCFQKITAPQAPAAGDEQKFVLTGTKVAERPLPKVATESPAAVVVAKNFPWIILIVVLVIGLAGAGVVALRGKIFNRAPAAGRGEDWRAGDIGATGADGSFSLDNGVYTVSGSGADIWHRADGFYSLFQTLNGDGALTAQVLNLQNTDEWAKAGVMIRETTNADSAFALASIRSDGQAQLIWRNATGQEAEASGLVGGTGFPKWVKIERRGNRFSAYFKVKAADVWEPLGTAQTINLSPSTQIGLIVCAHRAGTLSQAQFDQVALESGQAAASSAVESVAPKIILPPASDTNWTLNLELATTPEAAAIGRIHGQSSTLDRAVFQGGVLTLRPSVRGSPDVSLAINFGGALPEAIAGKTINVSAGTDKAAHVTLRWKAGDQNERQYFNNGYALRLEMGALANNHMPGKIYFCAPDELKSYVLGTFNAEIRKPKPKK